MHRRVYLTTVAGGTGLFLMGCVSNDDDSDDKSQTDNNGDDEPPQRQ